MSCRFAAIAVIALCAGAPGAHARRPRSHRASSNDLGADASNDRLSQPRADAVLRFL
jgi:hypothetical protein